MANGLSPNLTPLLQSFAQLQSSLALKAQREARAREAAKKRKAGAMRSIGTAAGVVVGAYVGGPQGAALGARVGNTAGGMIAGDSSAGEIAQTGAAVASEQRQGAAEERRETLFEQGQEEREFQLQKRQEQLQLQEQQVQSLSDEIETNIAGKVGATTEEFDALSSEDQKTLSNIRKIRESGANPQQKMQAIFTQVPESRFKTSSTEVKGRDLTFVTDRMTGKTFQLPEQREGRITLFNPRNPEQISTVAQGSTKERQLLDKGFVDARFKANPRPLTAAEKKERSVPTLDRLLDTATKQIKTRTGSKRVSLSKALSTAKQNVIAEAETASPERAKKLLQRVEQIESRENTVEFGLRSSKIAQLAETDPEAARSALEEQRNELESIGEASNTTNTSERIARLSVEIEKRRKKGLSRLKEVEEEEIKSSAELAEDLDLRRRTGEEISEMFRRANPTTLDEEDLLRIRQQKEARKKTLKFFGLTG